MKEYIYVIKLVNRLTEEGARTKEDESIISEHFEYLSSLKDMNKFVVADRKQIEDSKTMGIEIIKANDELTSENIMLNYPAVEKGIMTFEFYLFHTAVKQ